VRKRRWEEEKREMRRKVEKRNEKADKLLLHKYPKTTID